MLGNEKRKRVITSVKKQFQKASNSNNSPSECAEKVFPILKWLKTYDWKRTLLQDVIAGCTVGFMVVPQSMSYASIAGLPVQYGLYSALVPVYAYAVFGSSRQLAVGPVALMSLLLSNGLTNIIDVDENDPSYVEIYTTKAMQASFLVGVIYIFMGICRLGFVTIFLSHAVISGFTTGAAVIIGLSQVKYVVGYDVGQSKQIHKVLGKVFEDIEKLEWKTCLMGCGSIFALIVLKRIGKTYPRFKIVRALGPLLVTVFTTFLTWVAKLDIPTVGEIPEGLPSLSANKWFPIEDGARLTFETVIPMVVVGFMESIAIAKQLASKHKYELDSSVELIGLGVANFLGGMFMSYPVTGSFSRSAVNNETGAKSGISAIVTATIVLFVLLFLTPLFRTMV